MRAKSVTATIAVLALIAAEPALAHCGGGHGAYRGRAAAAPVKAPKAARQTREAAPPNETKPTAVAVAGETAATADAAKPAECKQYSATVGGMITVPCP